jgi:RimJ/RimL family protein N-acetyltransferase
MAGSRQGGQGAQLVAAVFLRGAGPIPWGRGCGAESRRTAVVRRLANCLLNNDASWRLMESLGMRREAHAVRESLHRSGQWLDTLTYADGADPLCYPSSAASAA